MNRPDGDSACGRNAPELGVLFGSRGFIHGTQQPRLRQTRQRLRTLLLAATSERQQLCVHHHRCHQARTNLEHVGIFAVEAASLHRLHHQDSDDPLLDLHRRGHQRLEAVLAGFGEVLEVRVVAGMCRGNGFPLLGRQAHEPFAEAQAHMTHRPGIEAYRRT